jgi:adenosylmethionine-8-amino-7-oxononanoate transaminase
MHKAAQLDHAYVWHPFTQMRDWLKREPIVIASGKGAVLRDVNGQDYIDANSSIWTNLHGHNHAALNAGITRQLGKIAHSSALGFANVPASFLAEGLITLANVPSQSAPAKKDAATAWLPTNTPLTKVFYGDNGSTSTEAGLKMAYEFTRRVKGDPEPRFLSLGGAYHGDTVGAVSLGHIDLFHKAYGGLLFQSDQVRPPSCYRCPCNKAEPARADARVSRKCNWECVRWVEEKFSERKRSGKAYAGFIFEPLMQGAAGLIPQPPGWLRRAAEIARGHGALLMADEVMTGFGRTGINEMWPASPFACHHEGVQPDLMFLAKGLTGGYVPMAATLTNNAVFEAFLGEYEEFKTFYHGHSYTANQVGAAAGLASLKLLTSKRSLNQRWKLQQQLTSELAKLWQLPAVGDIRQTGLVAGVELVRDWTKRVAFDPRERVGMRVCEAMLKRGVLTRPVGDVIVLMPIYCTTPAQLRRTISALGEAIEEVLGAR